MAPDSIPRMKTRAVTKYTSRVGIEPSSSPVMMTGMSLA